MTGVCDIGCNGYSNPPDCNQECTKGVCDRGCNGYSNPPECNAVAAAKDWTPEIGTSVAIGTLVIILISIVVLIVICRAKRKRPHTTSTPNNEDNSLTMLQFYDSVKLNNEYQRFIPEQSGSDSENLIDKGLNESSECEKSTSTNN
ncbi:hypothetical protein Btru_070370 [Bulinus truncatus]|nr:hypothetical protein Btru_070370 [Bulinus truncatus]